MPIRVAIVEDIDEIRESLRVLIDGSSGFQCKNIYASAEEAIDDLPKQSIEAVIMDIHLPGKSGVECVKELKTKIPGTQFIMYTVYDDDTNLFDALSNGANGYLLKSTQPAELLDSITEIVNGGAPMSSGIARRLVKTFQTNKEESSKDNDLSPREWEILQLMQQGFLYKEIADKLFISKNTVKVHIHNIYEKLQVKNRMEAINKVRGRN